MNYQESQQILDEIKKANRILLNCHERPDADSVGSALSMYRYIKTLGKEVKIISPNEILDNHRFLPDSDKVDKVSFDKFDFNEYDLFIFMDTANWQRAKAGAQAEIPKIKKILIDNHETGEPFADINLLDFNTSSVAEMIFLLFEDWKVDIDKELATTLLAGIMGDTGTFEYDNVSPKTLRIAADLMDKGANKNEIVKNFYYMTMPEVIHFWGEVLERFTIDKEGRFAYSAIPFEIFDSFPGEMTKSIRGDTADKFIRVAKDTLFGMLIMEESKDNLFVSFRSREDFDVSRIAVRLDGGGHKHAASGKVKGMPFQQALENILQAAREEANAKQY